jgi:aminoglycoside phosphotransferase (APT) family kinase protein
MTDEDLSPKSVAAPEGVAVDRAEDVADTWAAAEAADLPPLIVLEGLEPLVPGDGAITVRRLGAGHSNETFLVTRDGGSVVLRRPPRPPFPPTAHDVMREYRILTALQAHSVRAPRPILGHEDPDAIGAPFYLMEVVPGVVIRDTMPEGIDDAEGRRAAVSQFVDALVEVHGVPWQEGPLKEMGRPSGYIERQLRRWTEQWGQNRTRSVPEIDAVGRWLVQNRPETLKTTLVHGDAKLDNAIYGTTRPLRLEALVDWEMATLGDPLADVGFLCATYVAPGEDPDPVLGFSPATAADGSPDRDEIANWYAERSGLDLANLRWYEVFALWKLTVLLEGSYKRFLSGTTHDPFFERLKTGIPRMAKQLAARAEIGAARG